MKCRCVDFNEREYFDDGGQAPRIPPDGPKVSVGQRIFVFCGDVGLSAIVRRSDDGFYADFLDGTRIEMTSDWYALLLSAEESCAEIEVINRYLLNADKKMAKVVDIRLA